MGMVFNTTVVVSIVVFLLIALALVGILLYVKQKLTPSGTVKIGRAHV